MVRIVSALLVGLFVTACGGGGGSGSSSDGDTVDPTSRTSWVLRWNQIAIDASGFDHTASGGGDQLGPTKAARAIGLVHIAMYEALNTIEPRFQPYIGGLTALPNTSIKIAMAQAAHDTLAALFPSQTAHFAGLLAEDLSHEPDAVARENGAEFGASVAAATLGLRAADGSLESTVENELSYPFSNLPGHWRLDPLNPDQVPHGSRWSIVTPLVLESASQFRAPPPPAIDSVEYAEAYAEAFSLGGDGIITPTERTDEQTTIGIFWAYDGTPSLCAPPRLYNQLVRGIALEQGTTDLHDLTRLLTMVNVALADAGIAVWESKFFYDFWRPVTAIREADAGTGPTGLGDGNPLTFGDPTWTPLGAPASNLGGPNFTPPFPTYPSGHAGFGGTLFEILRLYYGTDDISFSFISDEFNGITTDNEGNVRPVVERTFSSFSEAEEENGRSRVYLGIHFNFDSTSSIALGRQVGRYVYSNAFQPLN